MDGDNKLAFLTHGSHCQSTHLDMIDTWRQIGKDDTWVIATLISPLTTIHTILISHMLIVQFDHIQFQSELIVCMTQIQSCTIIHHALQHLITARHITLMHCLAIHQHIHQAQMQTMSTISPSLHSFRVKIGQAANATKVNLSIHRQHSTTTEFIVLQAVVSIEIGKMFCSNIHTRKSHNGANPQLTVSET